MCRRNYFSDRRESFLRFFLGRPEGKKIKLSGWRGAGISKAIQDCRDDPVESVLDPFINRF